MSYICLLLYLLLIENTSAADLSLRVTCEAGTEMLTSQSATVHYQRRLARDTFPQSCMLIFSPRDNNTNVGLLLTHVTLRSLARRSYGYFALPNGNEYIRAQTRTQGELPTCGFYIAHNYILNDRCMTEAAKHCPAVNSSESLTWPPLLLTTLKNVELSMSYSFISCEASETTTSSKHVEKTTTSSNNVEMTTITSSKHVETTSTTSSRFPEKATATSFKNDENTASSSMHVQRTILTTAPIAWTKSHTRASVNSLTLYLAVVVVLATLLFILLIGFIGITMRYRKLKSQINNLKAMMPLPSEQAVVSNPTYHTFDDLQPTTNDPSATYELVMDVEAKETQRQSASNVIYNTIENPSAPALC